MVARFTDVHHVLASVLHRELTELGFDRSYPTLVRECVHTSAVAE